MAKVVKEYFSHDYYSRIDPKLKRLRKAHKMEGVGVYWSIVEMQYEQGGKLNLLDLHNIADELETDIKIVESVVNDFDLFRKKSGKFYSTSIQNRLKIRHEKSVKATNSANLRWGKKDANAMPSQSERNAKKESKEKDIKVKKSKGKRSEFLVPEIFSSIWERWKNYKRDEHGFQFRSTDTEKTAFEKLINLSGGDPVAADKIISESIGNGWEGLFALKNSAQPAKEKPDRNSMKPSFDMAEAYLKKKFEKPDDDQPLKIVS